MTLHETRNARPYANIRLPACPLCGDMLLAPMMAEHVSEHHVRNHWACESCGYTFRKSFEFEPRQEAAFLCDA